MVSEIEDRLARKHLGSPPSSPWYWAEQADPPRDYITPEDIGRAIHAGAEKARLWQEVLWAINDKECEDYRCCAFVAVDFDRVKAEPEEP